MSPDISWPISNRPECYGDVWHYFEDSASPSLHCVALFVGFAVLPFVDFVSHCLFLTSSVGDGSGLIANSLTFGLRIEEPYLRSIFILNWIKYGICIIYYYSGWASVMVFVIKPLHSGN